MNCIGRAFFLRSSLLYFVAVVHRACSAKDFKRYEKGPGLSTDLYVIDLSNGLYYNAILHYAFENIFTPARTPH